MLKKSFISKLDIITTVASVRIANITRVRIAMASPIQSFYCLAKSQRFLKCFLHTIVLFKSAVFEFWKIYFKRCWFLSLREIIPTSWNCTFFQLLVHCTYPPLVDDAGVDRRLLVGVVFDVVFLTALWTALLMSTCFSPLLWESTSTLPLCSSIGKRQIN